MVPSSVEITFNVSRDKAQSLFNILHDISLIHDIPSTVTHKLLKIIRQRFPTKIDPFRSSGDGLALKHGRGMRERESRVDHQAGSPSGEESARAFLCLVGVGGDCCVGYAEGLESEILED